MIPNKLTVHCSATPNGETYPGGWTKEIRKWHVEERGWSDIGYHIIIDLDEVRMGRPMNRQGAGVAGHNAGNLHLCLIGTDKFTGKQWENLRYYLDSITQIYNIYPENMFTHNQFNKRKTCPGFTINQMLSWYCYHMRWDAIRENWLK